LSVVERMAGVGLFVVQHSDIFPFSVTFLRVRFVATVSARFVMFSVHGSTASSPTLSSTNTVVSDLRVDVITNYTALNPNFVTINEDVQESNYHFFGIIILLCIPGLILSVRILLL